MGGLGIEKPFGAQSLLNYCGHLGSDAESRTDDGVGCACSFRGNVERSLRTLVGQFETLSLGQPGLKKALAVVNEKPALLQWNLCCARMINSGELGLKSQLWLRREQPSEIMSSRKCFLNFLHRNCSLEVAMGGKVLQSPKWYWF